MVSERFADAIRFSAEQARDLGIEHLVHHADLTDESEPVRASIFVKTTRAVGRFGQSIARS